MSANVDEHTPLREIRRRGLAALAKELGPVGLVRFLQQYSTGRGDYTRERKERFEGETVHSITQRIREQRGTDAASPVGLSEEETR